MSLRDYDFLRDNGIAGLVYDEITPALPEVVHGAVPYDMKAGAPFFMLYDEVYPDEFLVTDLLRHIKPSDGVKGHKPVYRKVIFDSLEQNPELLHHYLQSGGKKSGI